MSCFSLVVGLGTGGFGRRARDYHGQTPRIEEAFRDPSNVIERHRLDQIVPFVDVVRAESFALKDVELRHSSRVRGKGERKRALEIRFRVSQFLFGGTACGELGKDITNDGNRLPNTVFARSDTSDEQT